MLLSTGAVLAATAIAGCGSSHSGSGTAAGKPAAASSTAGSGSATSTPAASSGGAYGAPATTSSASPTAGSGASSAAGSGASSAAGSGGSPALITSKRTKLGTILAFGPKRLTVYLFEADRHGRSSCTGACAAAWPPVTGTPRSAGGALSEDLGTITRAGGIRQVTYKGHPLYRFVKDGDAGDAYGNGVRAFGAEWYALRPNGSKTDES